MKVVIYLATLFLSALSLSAQIKLSDRAQISLLTCSPSEEAVFTVYGHTAIRVCDSDNGMDIVFNYGLFDFSSDNFVYRFAKGKTDYKLGVSYFENFFNEYLIRGSGMTEQALNLTAGERDRIWEALQINMLPENISYRYNFFFDNCATRPAKIIEATVDGEVIYRDKPERKTFRELINHCMRNKPWLVFGCDLALGNPTDRVATPDETFFLPLFLEAAFDSAIIVSPGGGERPLVAAKNILLEEDGEQAGSTVFTPMVAALVCLTLILLLTALEGRKKTYLWADILLFTLAGLSGAVIFFLAFVSEHPAVWPNWSVVWLHPFHLLGAALFAVKRWSKAAYCYHFINFAALTLMLTGWYLIPQHFNAAFFPLIVCLWIRSGRNIFISYKKA
ncbi:MAG: DUF4105 domain-containing protein [Tannerellaceae bacterium]|jgi:hypothetical protein|nr:DUF4105 domain-containing protein [Tannerellaceae bacterium]